MNISLMDPQYLPIAVPNIFEQFALQMIRDKRDLPFIKLLVGVFIFVIPFAFFLFVTRHLNIWISASYLALVLGYFLGPVILMVHNTCHNPLFRLEYSYLKPLISWVVGPFFGQSPETYFAHHVIMHHNENNLSSDISSTRAYQRDSIFGFLKYLFSFYFLGFPTLLLYMHKRKRRKFFQKVLIGELSFYSLIAVLLWFNWKATLVVFIIPFIVARFAMMAGNWAQHAFLDRDAPNDNYLNSITCINSVYNKRCFNDGYHIGHHIKPTRHWTDMPEDFLKNQNLYAEKKAVVFQGIDYFGIWFILMFKRYDWLQKYLVQLDDIFLTKSEKINFLKSRTRML